MTARRTTPLSRRAAILLLLACLGPLVAPPAGRAHLGPIAATGQPAPGGGTFSANFGVPVINAAGQVAFTVQNNPNFPNQNDVGVYQGTTSTDLKAILRPGGGTTSVGRFVAENAGGILAFSANGGTQIVVRDSGGLKIFADAGDIFQPVAGGTKFTLVSVSDPFVNDAAPASVAYSVNGQLLISGGETLAYEGQGDLLNGQVAGIFGSSLDAFGSMAFFLRDSFQDGDVNALAVSSFANGIVRQVVQEGPLGGSTIGFDQTAVPIVSNAGIVFKGVSCTGFDCQSDIFLAQVFNSTSTITTLVKSGDAAPGGGTFATTVNNDSSLVFRQPQINDNGSVVFIGATDGGPGLGVYRFTQAHGLEAMALQGHAPYAVAAGFRNAVINRNDVVAFQAYDGSAGNARGVYVTDGVTTVRAGSDDYFGGEGSSTGALAQASYGSQTEGLSPLNDHGDVTFVAGGFVNGEQVMKFVLDPMWVKLGSGNWDTAANWTFGATPGPDRFVTIAEQAAGSLLVTGPAAPTTIDRVQLGGGPNAVELDLQSGGPLTATTDVVAVQNGVLGGTGTVTSGFFDIATGGKMTGTLTVNGTFDNSGTVDGDFTFNGDVTNRAGAVIDGNHTFNGDVTNMGTISPGHSPGSVTVNGDLTLQSTTDQGVLTGSDLEIEIGGSNPSDYDVINVTGHATLAGTLHVTFINGFMPAPGETFHILNAGGVSGAFDAVTGAVVTSTQGGIDIAPPSMVTSSPKALVACAKAVPKAGAGFTAARLKALDACAGGVLKCIEENDAGTKRDACVAKAGTACGKDLAKITGFATKLIAAIDKACAPVGAADALSFVGIGYQNVADDCANDFATPLDTLASIEQCVLRAHVCRGDTILDVQVPRAKELMRVAGVATADLDALACLPDNGGAGADLGAPKGAGKAVTACESTIAKGGDGFAGKVEKALTGCVGAVYSCVIEQGGAAACLGKAQTGCDKAFAGIDAGNAGLAAAFAKACAPPALDFTNDLAAASGANVAALASDCATLGVATFASEADYGTCLARRESCDVEDLVRFEAPRADAMLALVNRSLKSGFCP